jgi:DNA-binding ferritin-like protein
VPNQAEQPRANGKRPSTTSLQRRLARLFVAGLAAGFAVTAAVFFVSHQARQRLMEKARQAPTAAAEKSITPGTTQADKPGVASVDAAVAGQPLADNRAVSSATQSQPAVAARTDSASQTVVNVRPVVNTSVPTARPDDYKIIGLNLQTAAPTLVLQGQYAVGAKIQLSLRARSGDIIGRPSFQTLIAVDRKAGEIPTVELAALKLTPGRYEVTMTSPTFVHTNLFIGKNDAQFAAVKERYLKEISLQQQNEKYGLYRANRRFQVLAIELEKDFQKLRQSPTKWSQAYAVWKAQARAAMLPIAPLAKMAHENPSALAFPDEFKSFQTAVNALAEQARQLNTSVESKRSVASETVSNQTANVVAEFQRLTKRAGELSARQDSP